MERFLYLQDIHLEKSPFKVFGKVRVRVERDWTNPLPAAFQAAAQSSSLQLHFAASYWYER